MRYSFNPELDARLKAEWNKTGLSEEIQEMLLGLMDLAAATLLEKESRRIARCLVDEGLSPEKIKRITGCSLEELYPSTTYH
jgi:hypothetical protein